MELKKHKSFCSEAGDLRGLIRVGRWVECVRYPSTVDYFDGVLFGPELVFHGWCHPSTGRICNVGVAVSGMYKVAKEL